MNQGQTRRGGRPHQSGRIGVGRIGVLALFFGVGAVITPGTATAFADTAAPADTTASAPASDSPRVTTPRSSRIGRVAAPGAGSSPSAPADRHARSKRPAAAAGAGTPRPVRARNAAAQVGPDAAVVQPVAVVPAASVISAPAAAVAAAVDSSSVTPVADGAVSPAATPVMTVAGPQGSVSALAGDPLAWLGGGRNPLAPIAAPFEWATLAVSRRELARTARTVAPAAAVAAAAPASSPLTDALAQAGAKTAIVAAAKQFVLAVVGGGDAATAVQSGVRSLETNPLFSSITLDSLLTDPLLAQAAGSTTASVVSALAADPEIRSAIGAALNASLAPALGDLPVGIAPSVADAVVGFLADPAAGKALGTVAGSAVTAFLGQSGVVSALTGVAYQLQDALNGEDFGSALDAAWSALADAPVIRNGVVSAVASGVSTALNDASLVGVLGGAASSVVSDLAANPSTWSLVGSLIGPTYGSAIVGLLSDPLAAGHLADTAGTVLTGFLGAPGVVAALSGVAGQLAGALLDGTDPLTAASNAFDSLQTSSAIVAALTSTVSVALHSILGEPVVQDLVGAVAQKAVVDLVTSAVATSNLSPVVGQLVTATVTSLVADTAVQNLIGDIAPAIVGGTSLSEVAGTLVQAVIDQPALQTAVGTAVGNAVGSLIGDNPIGRLVGRAVGRTVTAIVRTVVRFAPLLNGLGLKLPGAAAAQSRSGSGYLLAVAR